MANQRVVNGFSNGFNGLSNTFNGCWFSHGRSQMKIRVFACAMDKLYKLDRRGLMMKHWLRRSFLIIYNRFWLSIIPVIWLKRFSPVSYLGEIQASFFASVLSFRHMSCKIEHCTWTSSKLKWHENSSAKHWFNKQNNPYWPRGTKSTSLSATD